MSVTEQWRGRAAELEQQAQVLRDDGDPAGAAELEDAALDYIIAAGRIELGATERDAVAPWE